MGAKSGLALKSLQWLIRGVQLLCAALVLGVYSYFLASLRNHDLPVATQVRAVEGIAGAGTLYALVALLLLCCVAGFTFTALVAILLDVAFIGAFAYVAVANRDGAGSCAGRLDTVFGSGSSNDRPSGKEGFTALPTYHTACRLETACLAVSIIAIGFFIFSILMEVALARHHRKEKRFGPSPANNYTSGYGSKRGGLLSCFRRKRASHADDPNALPEHTHPNQLDPTRGSYNTETTAVSPDSHPDYTKPETGHGYRTDVATHHSQHHGGWYTSPTTHQPPANYHYGDGVYDRA